MKNLEPFALPAGYDYDVKVFKKAVKTKKWVKQYANHLNKTADRLTTANSDTRQVIGGMLHNAYGVNIGSQLDEKLTNVEIDTIKANILAIVYG